MKHKPPKPLPPLSVLDNFFEYAPNTGRLMWKVQRGRGRVGDIAGCITNECAPRVVLGVNGENYLAHRIIWKMFYRQDPKEEIDHINGNPLDNRIKNLRDISSTVNSQNSALKSNNISGCTGVYIDKKNNLWVAQVTTGGKVLYLGGFKRKEDAIFVRKEAETKYGFHENHGRGGA